MNHAWHFTTSWTDDRVADLRRLWASGITSRVIADQMGLTRNAVLGKVDRLNLSGRSRNPHPHKQAPVATPKPPLNEGRARPPRPRQSQPPAGTTMQRTIIRPARAGGTGDVVTVEVPEACDLPAETSEFKCSIIELDETRCHWPLGTPGTADFGYCGDHAIDGKPYCCRHHAIAHKPYGRG